MSDFKYTILDKDKILSEDILLSLSSGDPYYRDDN